VGEWVDFGGERMGEPRIHWFQGQRFVGSVGGEDAKLRCQRARQVG